MKLVDILARELKVWPCDGHTIHQGAEGNIFTVQNGCLNLTLELADDWLPAEVARSQWQAAVDALKAGEQATHSIDWSKAPEGATHWDPVDRNHLRQLGKIAQAWNKSDKSWTCKGWQYPDDLSSMDRLIKRPAWSGEGVPPVGLECEFTSNDGRNWHRCSILFSDSTVVLLAGYQLYKVDDPDVRFRQIRTAEQIAAEERAKGIGEMIDIYKSNYEGLVAYGCQALYDAGYRKQEVQQ